MKNIFGLIISENILLFFLALIATSPPIYSQVRIMLLGDSITRDSFRANPRPDSILTGYRQKLWFLLKSGGYNVDFVGSDSSGYGAVPKFDPDNVGFGGYTTKQILRLLKTGYGVKNKMITPGPYLNYYPADIILLHIGTNELDTSSADVEDLLNYIDDYADTTNALIHVILAKIINRVPFNNNVSIFNKNLEKMYLKRINRGDKLKIVDMEKDAGIIYKIDTVAPYKNGDMFDKLHPNENGYKKMAALFYDTLKTILNKIIPIEFAGVSYVKNNQSNLLLWQTFLEVNNNGFEVERYSNKGRWNYLGFIKGKLNNHKLETYYFIDKNIENKGQTYKYRLLLAGRNGKIRLLANLKICNKNNLKTEENSGEFIATTFGKYDIPDKSGVYTKGITLINRYNKSTATNNPLKSHKDKHISGYKIVESNLFTYILHTVFINQRLLYFTRKLLSLK